jgi:hypothetical protein
MLLEIIVLIATLLVAVAATDDQARSNLGGSTGVIAILAATTAISIYLKFRAAREATQDRRRMALLLRSSRPNDYLIDLIDEQFFQIRNRWIDNAALKYVAHVSSPSRDGIRRTWFGIGHQYELIGFWTLSEEEIAEASAYAADAKQLRNYLDRELFGSWASGSDLERSVDKVGSHIAAWLDTRYDGYVGKWQIRWQLQDAEPRVTVTILLREGAQFSNEIEVSRAWLGHLNEHPAHERGVDVARLVDQFMTGHVDIDLEPVNGRPNVSGISQRLLPDSSNDPTVT